MLKSMIAGAAVIAMLTGAAMNNTAKTEETIVGGWEKTEETVINDDAKAIFDEATEKLIGVYYEAIELIETQLVNGTNYKFRAESQVVYPGAEKKEAIITIHKALDGTVTILDIEA